MDGMRKLLDWLFGRRRIHWTYYGPANDELGDRLVGPDLRRVLLNGGKVVAVTTLPDWTGKVKGPHAALRVTFTIPATAADRLGWHMW